MSIDDDDDDFHPSSDSSADSSNTNSGSGADADQPERLPEEPESKPSDGNEDDFEGLTKTINTGQGGAGGHFKDTTLGDFQLKREIGRGGMGIVYEATQVSLNKRVAVKLLPFASVLDPRVIQRFKNEARAAAQLTHRNIVPVYQVGSERGVYFYAMQYIDGGDLNDVFIAMREAAVRGSTHKDNQAAVVTRPANDVVRRGGDPAAKDNAVDADAQTEAAAQSPPPAHADDSSHKSGWSKKDTLASPQLMNLIAKNRTTSVPDFINAFVRMGIQVADALHYAHEMGVIHRDIKPSNLLLDTDGEVWVADFGLALIQNDPGLTQTDAVVGTLRYMSPEQAMGKRVGIDQRADIYSLGVTLYELMTLHRAFSGESREAILRKITFEDPVLPRKLDRRIPEELQTIVMKSIAKNPDHRYQTAAEMAEDLRLFQDGQPIKGRKPTFPQRAARWANRHRPLVASAAGMFSITFIASVIVAIMFWSFYNATAAALESEQEQRAEVERFLKRSEGLRLAANSSNELESDPTRALLLAVEGAKQYPGVETNTAILQARNRIFEEQTLTGHPVLVGDVSFNEDGSKLISIPLAGRVGAGPHAAIVWDVKTGNQLGSLKGDANITSAQFSPDQFRILTTSAEPPGRVDKEDAKERPPSIWDSVSFRELITFKDAFLPKAHRAAFNLDGSLVVLPSKGNAATIYDSVAGQKRGELIGHDKRVVFAAFSPQGDRVATISLDNTVKVWDTKTAKEVYHFTLWRDRDPKVEECLIDSIAFRADGRQLTTGSKEHGVHVWDLLTGDRVNQTHLPGGYAMYWADGKQLLYYRQHSNRFATASVLDGRHLRDFEHGEVLLRHVVISPDGRWIATNGYSNASVVYLWDVAEGEIVKELHGHAKTVNSVAFSPDSKTIATGGSDKTVRLWSLKSRGERDTFPTLNWPMNPVHVVSPDGSRFAVADQASVITGYLLANDGRQSTSRARGHIWMPRRGAKRYVVSRGNTLTIHSAANGEVIKSITGGNGSFRPVAINRTGDRVAAFDGGDVITLWLPDEDRQLGIPLMDTNVFHLEFSADGKVLVAACANGFAHLFDAGNGVPVASLQNDGKVFDAVFSSDGKLLAAVTDQNRANIWNLETKEIAATIWSSEEKFSQAEFSFDDLYLITYKQSGSARVTSWEVSTGAAKSSIDVAGEVQVDAHPSQHEVLVTSTQDGAIFWDYTNGESEIVSKSAKICGVYSADGSEMLIGSAARMVPNAWQRFGAQGTYIPSIVERWTREGLALESSTGILAGRILDLFLNDQNDAFVNSHEFFGVVNYDNVTGQELSRVAGHAAPVSSCLFSSDGSRLITASWDGATVLWNVKDGQEQARLRDDDVPIYAMALTSDDRYLVTGASDGECILWDCKTAQVVKRFQVTKSPIRHVGLNSSDNVVLLLTTDNALILYDLRTDQELDLNLSESRFEYAEFSPDGASLLAIPRTSDEGGLTDSDREFRVALIPMNGQSSTKVLKCDGPVATAHFDDDGDLALIATAAGTVTVFDVATGSSELLLDVDERLMGAVYDPTSKYVALMNATEVEIWHVQSRKQWMVVPCENRVSAEMMYSVDPFVPNLDRFIMRRAETGEFRLWPLDPMATAIAERSRVLTNEESARFLLTNPPN